MKSLPIKIIYISMLAFAFGSSGNQRQVLPDFSLKLIAENLEGPVGMGVANDGSNRLFIIEQKGSIRIIKNGKLLPTPFLDISKKTDHGNFFYSEKGLLGIAFHPKYKTNGKFYIFYSTSTSTKKMDNKSVIAEYTVAVPSADVAGNTSRILLEIDEPEFNHNGGCLAFGADGFLYIGVGDGGGGGDMHGTIGNGQNTKTMLGKILRIDVNTPTSYKIPVDNPFVKTQSKPEIFAYGLRNPWRFSFDRKTGKLFCADVGQDKWEEIDIIEKGKNYGWRIMEGNHCYNPSANCNENGIVLPIAEYNHAEGKSVTGGYVYRGAKYPAMNGKYIFADWTGSFFMLSNIGTQWKRQKLNPDKLSDKPYINSFGEDEKGELYVLGQKNIGPKKAGKIYQLILQ